MVAPVVVVSTAVLLLAAVVLAIGPARVSSDAALTEAVSLTIGVGLSL
jgi:hypothetical protein